MHLLYSAFVSSCLYVSLLSIKISAAELENPPPPPDVTRHKNIALLPDDCGRQNSRDRIRGGKDAMLYEFPWMALLSYNASGEPVFLCGGTIINEKYILTAAHCLKNPKIPLIFVRVGEYKISTTEDCENVKREPRCSQYPVQDLAIEEIIIHPKFSTTVFKDDIGLVRVTKMDFKPENVHPICLPVSEEARTKKFNNAVVTGWGYTNPYQPKLGDPGTKADILQQVGLVTRDLKECKKQYDDVPQARIKFTHICSGGFGEKDACPGDSGGPLQKAMDNDEGQLRSFQLGIVSFGPVICGTDGRPGVYTRISYYMDWILDNLKP